MLKKLLPLFLASSALAADDPQVQINALQAALKQAQIQTNQCNIGQINMAVEIDALQRKVQAFEDVAKKATEKKP